MRTESQIRQKLKQVIFRHRKKFIESRLKQLPSNCKHNSLVQLRTPSQGRHVFRCCTLKNEDVDQTDMVCDRALGGVSQAKRCPYFENRHTAEKLKAEFAKKLGLDGSPVSLGDLAREYPDIVALNWVLGQHRKDTNQETSVEGPGNLLVLMPGDSLEEPENLPEQPLLEKSDE